MLKFTFTGNNTVGIFSVRADADYKDPRGSKTPRPFQVVHKWTENGQAKQKVQTITRLPFSYTIDAANDPEMVSVSYEMAASGKVGGIDMIGD